MTNRTIPIIALLLFLLLCGPASAYNNYITNPNFNTNGNSWTHYYSVANPTYTWSNTTYHTNVGSQYINANSGTGYAYITQNINFTGATSNTGIGFWAKSTNGVHIIGYGAGVLIGEWTVTDSNWHYYEYQILNGYYPVGGNTDFAIGPGRYGGSAYFDDVTITNLSGAPTVPVASFTMSETIGNKPLTVQFTDTSTNTPTTWHWELGDGNGSIVQNPLHTFYNGGQYPISLNAINNGGDTMAYGMITVLDAIIQPDPNPFYWGDAGLSLTDRYYVTLRTGENKEYQTDVWVQNNTGYTKIHSALIDNQTYSAYPIDFSAPLNTGGNQSIYITVTDIERGLLVNSTNVPLVYDVEKYFTSYPQTIDLNATSLIKYASGYSYPSSHTFRIVYIGGINGNNVPFSRNDIQIDNIPYMTQGEYEIEGIQAFGLILPVRLHYAFVDDYTGIQVADTYITVGSNVSQPDVPDNTTPPIIDPVIPPEPTPPPPYVPPYTPPTPSPPYIPPDTPPANNSTPYVPPPIVPPGNGSDFTGGDYPMENGTNSVKFNNSIFGYIDGIMNPLNTTVNGFVGYTLSPINGMTGYVNGVNTSFVTYSTGVYNNSFLTQVMNPIFTNIPWKIVAVILYVMTLNLLAFLLRYR